MYFHKIDAPENFSFGGDRRVAVTPRLTHLGEGVFRLEIRSRLWKADYSHAVMDESGFQRSQPPSGEVALTNDGGIRITRDGETILKTREGMGFGLSGCRWMMVFDYNPDMRFYGLGEKFGRLEKTGVRTRFWNTDVMSDFAQQVVRDAEADPLYVAVPYLLIVRPHGTVGVLVDNPLASFISVAAVEGVAQLPEQNSAAQTFIGAPDGRPRVYFIVGETPLDVTRKLQRLCGPTPLPPLWALGHHQSRWGYQSAVELKQIAEQFKRYSIPNDGLWLDIEYMDGYRVFTFNKVNFRNPKKELSGLSDYGRVCPILDPGVKAEPGYGPYDVAVKQKLLCLNSEGRPYIGFVWPGKTAFPDFSLEKTRSWWADHVKELAQKGISGVWIDMNDPSTGSADFDDMLFGEGKLPHEAYHNQYALGMQMATREGFLRARPHERPFVLSRSGYISTSRFAAIWTGDNVSNYTNLRQSIPTCLNLSLSGIPFVGSDIGGFDGDVTPELLVDWYKSAFLFPIFRNHAHRESRRQEPWAMGTRPRQIIASYIRARYKLLPYLYSLFSAQEGLGDPILRPLFLEFHEEKRLDLSRVDDQFMAGSAIMQAPFFEEAQTERNVVLPSSLWFDPAVGEWVRGGRKISVQVDPARTPIYFREGTIVPMLRGEPRDRNVNMGELDVHLFVARRGITAPSSPAMLSCPYDDGLSYDYRDKGRRSMLSVKAWTAGNTLHIDLSASEIKYRPFDVQFVLYDTFKEVVIHGAEQPLSFRQFSWTFCGHKLQCRRSSSITIDQHSR